MEMNVSSSIRTVVPVQTATRRPKVNNNITASYALGPSPENSPIPNPVQTFEQCFSEYPEILTQIYNQSFTKPSPIQSQAWPILLKGLDLIGVAQTGTGKTLAFLLPGLIHTDLQPIPRSQRGGPNVLVLAPTRELALQIEKEVKKYNYRDIKSGAVLPPPSGERFSKSQGALPPGPETCTQGSKLDRLKKEVV
uniref:Helicase ATP-binding domain-containing protein n=1 Tax=Timema poppense TaxID=170557 RepID=A0A7R9DVN9_TIMPO|nr:unnamed protein product [Timema poppensis]